MGVCMHVCVFMMFTMDGRHTRLARRTSECQFDTEDHSSSLCHSVSLMDLLTFHVELFYLPLNQPTLFMCVTEKQTVSRKYLTNKSFANAASDELHFYHHIQFNLFINLNIALMLALPCCAFGAKGDHISGLY